MNRSQGASSSRWLQSLQALRSSIARGPTLGRLDDHVGDRRAGSRGREPLWTLTGIRTIWPDLAMKRVKIAELKDHLSAHLRSVERGGELEVTDRERPIARIVPI